LLFANDEDSIPLLMHNGHLTTITNINDSISASIFLESGFPRIVMNLDFAILLSQKLNLKLISEKNESYIALWDGNSRYSIKYHLHDSIRIFGFKQEIDALVVDFNQIPDWKNIDIVYPIYYIKQDIQLHIKDGFMKLLDMNYTFPESDCYYPIKIDTLLNALYCHTELEIDTGISHPLCLPGNYLIDLGAANAIVLNRNNIRVDSFLAGVTNFQLDSARFSSNKKIDGLKVIEARHLQFLNSTYKDIYIIAMRFNKNYSVNNYEGIIGVSFLRHHNILIDWKRYRILLEKNSQQKE